MKTIVLNYGRLSPFDEPHGKIPSLTLKVETRRIVWGNVGVTTDGDLGNEVYLETIDGCFYYDGIWYSDIWFEDEVCANECEDFNPSLAKIPSTLGRVMRRHQDSESETDITSDTKHSILVDKIVGLAKRCDGETMQYILERSAQDEQMLNQLIRTYKESKNFSEELEGMVSREEIEHRMAMILDDLKVIKNELGDERLNKPTNMSDALRTNFNNIEIACNLADKESKSWKLYYDLRKYGGIKQ